jgi:hypothetical protein
VTRYYDLAIAAVPKAIAKQAEAKMVSETHEFQKIADAAQGTVREAEKAAKAEGNAEGRAQGRTEGWVESRAEDVVIVLEARGIGVSSKDRTRIADCTDLQQLGRWLRRAVTADKASDLFVD